MNKLNVALRLLRLLHERQFINAKIVADDLDVSIRTAQRYLADLSIMPCVINKGNNHTFALNPDFNLRSFQAHDEKYDSLQANHGFIHNINSSLCLLCGDSRTYFKNTSIFKVSSTITKDNYEVNRLLDRIEKRLSDRKCSFSGNCRQIQKADVRKHR